MKTNLAVFSSLGLPHMYKQYKQTNMLTFEREMQKKTIYEYLKILIFHKNIFVKELPVKNYFLFFFSS